MYRKQFIYLFRLFVNLFFVQRTAHTKAGVCSGLHRQAIRQIVFVFVFNPLYIVWGSSFILQWVKPEIQFEYSFCNILFSA